jgi:hypothetical protein
MLKKLVKKSSVDRFYSVLVTKFIPKRYAKFFVVYLKLT